MSKLNLTANDETQKRILEYLQANASDTLVEKINNGVQITVDDKELVNKKDLSGFMTYASQEARKLCEKGAKSACVEDATVYGWAIHYFEEDSIQGTLYNPDGTPYKKVTPKTTTNTTVTAKTVVAKPEPKDKQLSFFDFDNLSSTIDEEEEQETEQDDEQDDTEIEELENAKQQVQEVADSYANVKPFYKKYCELKRDYLDYIVLYRLGDFYEIFDDDAIEAGKILDLTVTGREVGLQERVPLVGVPYHAVDRYIQKLSTKRKIFVYDCEEMQYLIENGQRIDTVTGEATPAFENVQVAKQTTPPAKENPHVQYLQSLVDNLRADL